LGAAVISRTLSALHPWGFAVATPEEGLELREAGVRLPVLVLCPAFPAFGATYADGRLTAMIDDVALAKEWKGPFHVEVDTGMSRCGVRWDSTEILEAISRFQPEGVFTHLHSAANQPAVDRQLSRFETALRSFDRDRIIAHVANSVGVWAGAADYDLIRPGMYLYGGLCPAGAPSPHPVVSLRTRVISLRSIPAGETVSYGATWQAVRDTVVATLGIGYADGLSQPVQSDAYVLLRGRRCPVIGRVTMNMTMVDVSPVGNSLARCGDAATLIGSDGVQQIGLETYAGWSGISSYEALTRLAAHLPRYYIDASQSEASYSSVYSCH
jgi:alanine racemase